MQKFSLDTKVYFGEGALEYLRRVSDKKVLIVTDGFMSSIGVPELISSYMSGCTVSVFEGVVPDPPIEVIASGVQDLQLSQAEIIIAVGGGSTIDAAKAIRAVGAQALGMNSDEIELIAIPTTSGTGSEVTDYAVISDKERGIKYPLDSKDLSSSVAILDPSLTMSVPPAITADTGMDVLTHALEAYVSQGANDFTDALCEKAVALVFEFLPRAFKDGTDVEAREKMHNASCMAGMAFNTAGLGLNHGIAHALGAKFHIPHGRANALMLAHVMMFNADLENVRNGKYALSARKYCALSKMLGLPAPSVRLGAHNLIKEVSNLGQVMKVPATLKACGVSPSDARPRMDELTALALADMTTSTNPRVVSEKDIATLINRIIG